MVFGCLFNRWRVFPSLFMANDHRWTFDMSLLFESIHNNLIECKRTSRHGWKSSNSNGRFNFQRNIQLFKGELNLTAALKKSFFLDTTNPSSFPSFTIYVFNTTYRSNYNCLQRWFCIFDIFICSDNDILFHVCLHAWGR